MNKVFVLILSMAFSACRQVNTIHPQKKDIVETVYASGKILARNEYNVYALSSGTIIKKLVKEGDTVAKGQILYVIKYDGPVARLDAARSSFANAEANLSKQSRILNDLRLSMQNAEMRFANDSLQYARLKRMMEQHIGMQSNLDNAYTNFIISLNQKKSAEEKYYATFNDLKVSYHNAKSQLANAQTELDNFFVRSDAGGTVYETFKEQGEAVKANEAVALLGETRERIIRLSVDQQDISRIQNGQQVLLKTDLTGNTIYRAFVQKAYPVMNESDQTFRVDAFFADSATRPFIHSSVEANIIIRRKNYALVIPRNTIAAGDSVQVIKNGKKKSIAVFAGIRTLDEAEILNGLDESSLVVVPQKK